ncbi:MAG: hypothetical protein FJW88_08405 [Actinobacteria bacterium]|nr:hypothetical protein [Actinomycetota bacterium]
MTVCAVWTPEGRFEVTGSGYGLDSADIAEDKRPVTATACRALASASWPRLDTIPFSSDRQYMATMHQPAGDDLPVFLVKGAWERVLESCASRRPRGAGFLRTWPPPPPRSAQVRYRSSLA